MPRHAKRIVTFVTLAAFAAVLGGCTTYYQVNDVATQRSYYATKVDKHGNGAVRLTDAKTGADVTLQSSEVKEISKEQYEAAVGKK
ncbi:MAG: hypothetical protein QM783_02160 [Phycisphaerales bacterium]